MMEHDKTDGELARRSSFGDKEAFTQLVQRYSKVLYCVDYSILRDVHAAQDTTQDTFVKA